MEALQVDLSRFNTNGYGTVYGISISGLTLGQAITVTDDDADRLPATVIAIRPGAVDLQVHWPPREGTSELPPESA